MTKKFWFIKIILIVSIYLFPARLNAIDYTPLAGSFGKLVGYVADVFDGIGRVIKNIAEAADPVNLSTGEFYHTDRDFILPGRVLSVSYNRHYRAQSEYNSRFGYGWDMNYNLKVRKLHDTTKLVFLNGENGVHEYTVNPSNSNRYDAPLGDYSYIEENTNGTFTLYKKYGTQLDFDVNGNLKEIRDRIGNNITFSYNSSGLLPVTGPSDYFVGQSHGLVAMEYMLETITDDLGRDIDFSYNSNGLLSSITDYAGRTWSYAYDPNTNDLLSVTSPATVDFPNGLTESYTYDPNHNLLTVTDPNGVTYLENTYVGGKVAQQVYGTGTFNFNYNDVFSEVTVTDRKGYDTLTTYNSSGNPIREELFTLGLRVGDPNSYVTQREFNDDLEITKVIFPAGNSIEYTYDSMGNLLSKTQVPKPGFSDPNITMIFTYESKYNQVKTITGARGFTITNTFDYEDPNNYTTSVGHLMKITYPTISTPTGNVTPEINYTYNSFGQVETTTSTDGIISRYEYYTNSSDAINYGKLKTKILDYGIGTGYLNITTDYSYDAYGNIKQITDHNGNVREFTYNEHDLLVQAKGPAPFNYQTDLSYDKNKLVKQTVNHLGQINQVIDYEYDLLDNLAKIIDPMNHTFSFNYDGNDNQSAVIDAESNQTQYEYDERNLLWKVTDANSILTEYSYDNNGNLTLIKDGKGNVTSYTYDGFDRLIEVLYPDSTKESYEYDVDLLINQTSRKGQTITYSYDAIGRMIGKGRPNDPNIIYDYDIASEVVQVTSGNDTISYNYDRVGRLTQAISADSKVVDYEYDDLGRRTKLVYPDSSYITYEYDEISRLTKIKDNSGAILVEYSYDDLSRRSLLKLNNGSFTEYSFDIGNRLTNLSNFYTHDAIAHWNLNDNASSQTVIDSSSNSYNGTSIQNTNLLSTTGQLNNGFAFNGTSDYIEIDGYQGVTGTSSRTVAAWIKTSSTGDVINWGKSSSSGERWVVDLNGTSNGTSGAVQIEVNGGYLIGNTSVTDNQWHHIAVVLKEDTIPANTGVNDIQIYVDGLLDGDINSNSAYLAQTINTMADPNVHIGLYTSNYFNGTMDNIMIFDRALSAIEVNRLYLSNEENTFAQTFAYSHDKQGNRTAVDVDAKDQYQYTYDNLYQLTNTNIPGGSSITYNYDELGNRNSVNDGTAISYVSNSMNQYTAVGGVSYTYDDNGNLTNDGAYDYFYDEENRLVKIEDNSTAIVEYEYDYLGRRIKKIVGTSVTKYVYDGDHVIAEYNGSDILLRKYIYGSSVDEPIMLVDVNGAVETSYYYHFDGIGSVTSISDSNSVVVESYAYDDFGDPTLYDTNGSILTASNYGNPYLFTARRYEHVTGHYDYRARVYAPVLGRFLQTDPIGYYDGLNMYTYVGNNPVNWIDPYGLSKNLDRLQVGLDVAGVADPTPIVDGINALIYLARGKYADAAISAGSMIPYAGDIVFKGGKYGAKGVKLLDKAGDANDAGKTVEMAEAGTHGVRASADASEEGMTRIRHYTNRKGSNGIERDGVIKASDQNKVFAESTNKPPLSRADAEDKYQIGKGRGRDYVETDVPTSRVERTKNSRTGKDELTIEGDVPLQNANITRRK